MRSRMSLIRPLPPFLLFLAIVELPFILGEPSNLIQGELDVLIPEGHPPLFIVRNDSHVIPVVVPEDAVEELTSYAGYIIQLRTIPSPTPVRDPSLTNGPTSQLGPSYNQPSTLRHRNALQSQNPTGPMSALLAASGAIPGSQFRFVDGTFEVLGKADPGASKNAFIGAQDITTVIYLLSFCGYERAINASAFRVIWLNTPATPRTAYTMQNFWANCSQGLARLSAQGSTVVEISLPCTGRNSNGEVFNFSSQCRHVEVYAWMNLAEAYVRDVLKLSVSDVKQRIAVLPKEVVNTCPWAGLAATGCTGTRCFAWINGLAARDLTLYMHEMGHNFGLKHSPRWNSTAEYGDPTCTMGSASACYSMANLWRLGWAAPVRDGELNSTNLTPGTWKTFELPYATRAMQNHIRIVPDWAPPPQGPASDTVAKFPGYYVSLRVKEGFDAVPSEWVPVPGRVLVHSSRATQVVNSIQASTLEGVLSEGSTYRTSSAYGIVVRVSSITYSVGATVEVCRADRSRENDFNEFCYDGLDNDCDGRYDFDDPDCLYVLRPNPSKPPSRPPPQRKPPRPSPPPTSPLPPSPLPPPIRHNTSAQPWSPDAPEGPEPQAPRRPPLRRRRQPRPPLPR